MLHSLRLRLLLLLIVVVAVTAGTLLVLTSQVMVNQFQRYLAEDMQRNQLRVDTLLRVYSEQQPGLGGQVLAERVSLALDERIIQTDVGGQVLADSAHVLVGQSVGCQSAISAIVVTVGPSSCAAPLFGSQVDHGGLGTLLFVSALPALPARAASEEQMPFSLSTTSDAGLTDTLFIAGKTHATSQPLTATPLTIRRTQGPGLTSIEASFIRAVNQSLLSATAVACLAALLLTALFSRHILNPIGHLTNAAHRMAQGDLSQRVQVASKDELGMLARAFNAMADGLSNLEQLRRNMVSDVAHELRTPLTNIRGYLEAMQDGLIAPVPEQLASLYEETMILNRLVEDLQDLALAEAGQLRLLHEPFDLGAAIRQAVHAIRPCAAAKGVELQVVAPASLPLIEADPERIGQVLRNLLTNAIAHTPAGGAVSVVAASAATELTVQVRDTGVGIADEHLPYIFERFFRADPARGRTTGGAGLGLTIVKELIEAHGGRVGACSPPGAGATFTFTLPRGV